MTILPFFVILLLALLAIWSRKSPMDVEPSWRPFWTFVAAGLFLAVLMTTALEHVVWYVDIGIFAFYALAGWPFMRWGFKRSWQKPPQTQARKRF